MKLTEAQFNFADKISRSALLTATKADGSINTMTVSWGGCGILWGREVCFIFVRPERYTFEFCQEGTRLSLSFFDDNRKDTLSFCGTKSGREVDKFDYCSLEYTMEEGACVYKDSEITILLEKIYADDIKKECFVGKVAEPFYQKGGYHKMYICEVKDIIEG